MRKADGRIALVTGASRAEGLGYEICRQLALAGMKVALTARDGAKAQALASELSGEGLEVSGFDLDVTSDESVQRFSLLVDRQFGRLDVLINNAGGGYDTRDRASSVSIDAVREAIELNLLGSWRVCQSMLPLLRKADGGGCIVNVSSQAAAFVDAWGPTAETGGLSAYIVSKAALNALTRKLAFDLRADRILVNAACPGWVATYPGTAEMGARPVRDGAASVVWAAMLDDDGPTGSFFRDGKALQW